MRNTLPSCKDLNTPSSESGSRKLHLPFTKIAGNSGEDVYLCAQNSVLDSIAVLDNHFTINKVTDNLPLFCYSITPTHHLALTKKKFLKRCNDIWTQANMPTLTGHSFQIGGTMELLIHGVLPDVVKYLGRWKSDVFLLYWRSLELLAPLYVEYLPDCAHKFVLP